MYALSNSQSFQKHANYFLWTFNNSFNSPINVKHCSNFSHIFFTLLGAKWDLSPGGPSLYGLNHWYDSNHNLKISLKTASLKILYTLQLFLKKKDYFCNNVLKSDPSNEQAVWTTLVLWTALSSYNLTPYSLYKFKQILFVNRFYPKWKVLNKLWLWHIFVSYYITLITSSGSSGLRIPMSWLLFLSVRRQHLC